MIDNEVTLKQLPLSCLMLLLSLWIQCVNFCFSFAFFYCGEARHLKYPKLLQEFFCLQIMSSATELTWSLKCVEGVGGGSANLFSSARIGWVLCVSRKTDVGCQIYSGFTATFEMTLMEKRWQSGVERQHQFRCDWIECFTPTIPGLVLWLYVDRWPERFMKSNWN